jgi:hypothetical protein
LVNFLSSFRRPFLHQGLPNHTKQPHQILTHRPCYLAAGRDSVAKSNSKREKPPAGFRIIPKLWGIKWFKLFVRSNFSTIKSMVLHRINLLQQAALSSNWGILLPKPVRNALRTGGPGLI